MIRQKLYAILIIDYVHNGNITLYNKVFTSEEDAKNEIRNMAHEYIIKNSRGSKKNKLEFREDTSIVCSKSNGSSRFGEILYQIQSLTLNT